MDELQSKLTYLHCDPYYTSTCETPERGGRMYTLICCSDSVDITMTLLKLFNDFFCFFCTLPYGSHESCSHYVQGPLTSFLLFCRKGCCFGHQPSSVLSVYSFLFLCIHLSFLDIVNIKLWPYVPDPYLLLPKVSLKFSYKLISAACGLLLSFCMEIDDSFPFIIIRLPLSNKFSFWYNLLFY